MKPPRKNRRDLVLILLLVPLGMLCMLITGQMAIQLRPFWQLQADLRSLLNPTANFLVNDQGLFEPLNTNIPPAEHRPENFLTPNGIIPTSAFIVFPTPVRKDTPVPTVAIVTPVLTPPPTPTIIEPIIVPTSSGPSFADLVITKTDRSGTYTPGASVNYRIVVTNRGPDRAPTFDIVDNVPANITGLTVDCTPAIRCGTNTSSGNNISFTGASLFNQQGGDYQITITISGTVSSDASGNLSNTASVIAPNNSRFSDPNTNNNSVTDTDTQLSVHDLAITKSDGGDTYTTTNPLNYTVVVTNNGPSDARGVRVVDNLTPQITSWTWTCVMINASGCNEVTSYRNDFIDNVNIQAGGRIEYSVTANPAGGIAQNLSNTANIIIPGGSTATDPNLSNNSSTDTDIPFIDLQIEKTDGGASYAPGGTVPYTVIVTNNSTFDLTGITILDPKPAQITTWSWTCAGGGCTPVNNSNANFTDTIDLAAGSSLAYNVTANVSGTAGLGSITNTATVSAPAGLVDADGSNNSATNITPPYVDLQITKTDGVDTYTPGGTLTYTVTVTNKSAFDLTGVTVTDNVPVLIDPTTLTWTCRANPPPPGATCAIPSGTGNINTTVDLPAGASVVFTIDATVRANAAGTLDNTATVSLPTGLTDITPGDNTATDSDASSVVEPNIGPPNGNWINIPEGSPLTYVFSPGILANGDVGTPDLVFYERIMNPTADPALQVVQLDWVQIEISADGLNWFTVFYWGDSNPGIPDTNSNMDYVNLINDLCTFEEDNCSIPIARMYNSTGVTIDIDAIPGISTGLRYSWIRLTSPVSPGGDPSEVDAIQPYYP